MGVPEPTTDRAAHLRTIAAVLVVLACAAGLARYGDGWPVDNRVDSWASSTGNDPAYRALVDRFDGDAAVLVRVDRLDLDSAAHGALLDDVADRLRALPGARAVLDPRTLAGGAGAPLVERLASVAATRVGRALDAASTDPPRVDFLIAVEPNVCAEDQDALAAGIEELRGEARDAGARLRAAGHPLVGAGLDAESRRVDQVFGPLLVVFAALACSLFLRSPWLGIVTMLPGVLASLAVRAGLRAVGIDANMILVAGAPLVFVVLVASTLHLTMRFLFRVGHHASARAAARQALSETFGAALVAAVTTAIGFAVFAVSDVRAVRHLGLTVGAIVSVAVPLSYLGVAALLPGALTERRASEERRRVLVRSGRRWRRLAAFSARRSRAVVAIALLGTALGALAPFGMPVSTDALDYFPKGHAVREEFLGLEAEGATLSTLDVLVRPPDGEAFDGPWVAALAERLSGLDGVAGVVGPLDVSADLEQRVGKALARVGRGAAWAAAGRVDADGELGRLTLRSRSSNLEAVEHLAARAQAVADAAQHGAAGSEARVASSLLRLSALHEALVGTLALSLGLTGGVALLAFFALLRGGRERLAALVANTLPVALALAAVRALGYALDAATVMVASVVMGIAVDTTFHLLLAARHPGASRFDRRRATLLAFGKVGDAAAASAAVLVFGFSALCLADFAPTARFGLASAIGVAAAWFGDLLVVPAILLGGRDAARSD